MAKDRKAYQAEYYQKNKERLNEYKKNYEKNVMRKRYKHYVVYVPLDISEEFDKKLIQTGETITEVLNKAIEKYIGKRG